MTETKKRILFRYEDALMKIDTDISRARLNNYTIELEHLIRVKKEYEEDLNWIRGAENENK